MGHEMVTGFHETEEPNLKNSSKLEDGYCSKTLISSPKEFPSSSIDSNIGLNGSISGEDDSRVSEMKTEGKSWVVIDVKCEEEMEMKEEERVCRICHLRNEKPLKDSTMEELIWLGCGCKGGLSVAHLHCGEAWFKLKGNRKCEICGEIAKHVRGVGDEKFMEEWTENGVRNHGVNDEENSERIREVCWHGQPLCNFLMACLVIAFVLPWFLRINGRIW